jgi:hypothetical protein
MQATLANSKIGVVVYEREIEPTSDGRQLENRRNPNFMTKGVVVVIMCGWSTE